MDMHRHARSNVREDSLIEKIGKTPEITVFPLPSTLVRRAMDSVLLGSMTVQDSAVQNTAVQRSAVQWNIWDEVMNRNERIVAFRCSWHIKWVVSLTHVEMSVQL